MKISNAFNEFFASFEAPNNHKKNECASFIFDRFRNFRKMHLKQLNGLNKFSFRQIAPELVEKLINDLDNKSSWGISDIPISIIKFSAKTLSLLLSELFNFCITNNCLPNEWKFAMVTPLYKNKGDLSDFNNYRGISVLSPFAKLFERVIQRQILDYFNSNKLFHESQHGFRSGFS